MASPRHPYRTVLGGLLLAASAVLTGCFTGERPSFESEVAFASQTGNEAIDDVLERLDRARLASFTGDYDILTRLGGLESTAHVVQDGPGRRSVTVNDSIRFVVDGDAVATCDLGAAECEASINDARISDVIATHDFYADSAARRLRTDADRRILEPTGYEITQAGQPALCVDVPVTGGTVSYCALESGPLARYDGSDTLVELTSSSDTPDETAFDLSPEP
jgi:hypothetical protein